MRSRTSTKLSTVLSGAGSASSATLNLVLHERYRADLQQLLQRTRSEEDEARQQDICAFIELAAAGDCKGLASILNEGKVKADVSDYDQRTALHLAVCNGHLAAAQLLVEEYSASIFVKDRFGHTPLDDAIREQQLEAAQYLVNRGAHFQVGADMAGKLCQAAFDNDIDGIRLLVEIVGVDPNMADYDGRTALHLAACEGHMEVVEMLVNRPDININVKDRFGNTPLDDSARHGHSAVRRLLHSRGARIGDHVVGVNLCMMAAKNEVHQLRELAESGVPLGEGDYDARTALHLAASTGALETATYLLTVGKVDPNALDRFCSTPLDDALRHNMKAMEWLLRDYGGMLGSNPKLADAVEAFHIQQEKARQEKRKEKLERELKTSELRVLSAGLQRLAADSSLEDDVQAFISYSATFRSILLQLLRGTASGLHPVEPPGGANAGASQEIPSAYSTKVRMERLMEHVAVNMDTAASRLVTTIEAKVLPFLSSLSRKEARVLKLFLPQFEEGVIRVRDRLKGDNNFRRFVRTLRSDDAYQCSPIGLLAIRASETSGEVVKECRVQAVAMLWLAAKAVSQHAPTNVTGHETTRHSRRLSRAPAPAAGHDRRFSLSSEGGRADTKAATAAGIKGTLVLQMLSAAAN